ncbi:MAG: HTH-type transcriptional activator IlvY [Cellvibrionales bacterium]|nr:HTH-type transcriptional activator IlvY [Cellvibrionales bacterium]
MGNIDIRQMVIFQTLAQTKHFAKTAEVCHLTPSAVTRSIQRIEEELDCQLIIREGRNFQLTHQGKAFYAFASETLSAFGQFQMALAEESDKISGELTIFCSVTASYSILPALLERFRQLCPNVEILLHTGDQADALDRVASGKEAIAVSAKPIAMPDSMVYRHLGSTPLRFIMPSAGELSKEIKRQVEKSPLINPLEYPMIVADRGVVREVFDGWVQSQALSPSIYAQVSGHEAIVSMVALECGLGLVPEVVIDNSPLKDKISVIDAAPELPVIDIGLYVLKNQLNTPVVKRFWQLATQHMTAS